MNKEFIISTDSCCDHFKSYLADNLVPCVNVKRILNGKEMGELYDSVEEFDNFYEELKTGALPTTAAINPFELQEFFEGILADNPKGDLIHICLSSGLSLTYTNAVKAAEEVNNNIKGRKVHVVDSLIATQGMAMLVDKLIEMRDAGMKTEDALKKIIHIRDHQQGWVIMSDLFHLKRGGRISGIAATVGSILGVKPIICLNREGKLAKENKMKGAPAAIKYLIGKMEDLGEKFGTDFSKQTVYLVRTTKSKMYDDFKEAALEKWPNMQYKERIVGPIIGTHLGGGGICLLFEGAPRLDVKA
jgi:DegV family protein with EDD domain